MTSQHSSLIILLCDVALDPYLVPNAAHNLFICAQDPEAQAPIAAEPVGGRLLC